jgi:hypothetical protein
MEEAFGPKPLLMELQRSLLALRQLPLGPLSKATQWWLFLIPLLAGPVSWRQLFGITPVIALA